MSYSAFIRITDVVFLARILIPRACLLFHGPIESCAETRGADQPAGIIKEARAVEQTQLFGFDVRHAIEWVDEQSARAFVQRERHGVTGEIAPAQVFMDGGKRHFRRAAGFLESLKSRSGDFATQSAGQ